MFQTEHQDDGNMDHEDNGELATVQEGNEEDEDFEDAAEDFQQVMMMQPMTNLPQFHWKIRWRRSQTS